MPSSRDAYCKKGGQTLEGGEGWVLSLLRDEKHDAMCRPVCSGAELQDDPHRFASTTGCYLRLWLAAMTYAEVIRNAAISARQNILTYCETAEAAIHANYRAYKAITTITLICSIAIFLLSTFISFLPDFMTRPVGLATAACSCGIIICQTVWVHKRYAHQSGIYQTIANRGHIGSLEIQRKIVFSESSSSQEEARALLTEAYNLAIDLDKDLRTLMQQLLALPDKIEGPIELNTKSPNEPQI